VSARNERERRLEGSQTFAPSFDSRLRLRRLRLREATSGKPLWIAPKGPVVFSSARVQATKFLKRAAPANDSNASFVSWYIKLVIRTEC